MKNITVIGAGTMGNGIAHTFAQKNFNVKNFNCFLSISDEKDYSTAFAIIQSI